MTASGAFNKDASETIGYRGTVEQVKALLDNLPQLSYEGYEEEDAVYRAMHFDSMCHNKLSDKDRAIFENAKQVTDKIRNAYLERRDKANEAFISLFDGAKRALEEDRPENMTVLLTYTAAYFAKKHIEKSRFHGAYDEQHLEHYFINSFEGRTVEELKSLLAPLAAADRQELLDEGLLSAQTVDDAKKFILAGADIHAGTLGTSADAVLTEATDTAFYIYYMGAYGDYHSEEKRNKCREGFAQTMELVKFLVECGASFEKAIYATWKAERSDNDPSTILREGEDWLKNPPDFDAMMREIEEERDSGERQPCFPITAGGMHYMNYSSLGYYQDQSALQEALNKKDSFGYDGADNKNTSIAMNKSLLESALTSFKNGRTASLITILTHTAQHHAGPRDGSANVNMFIVDATLGYLDSLTAKEIVDLTGEMAAGDRQQLLNAKLLGARTEKQARVFIAAGADVQAAGSELLSNLLNTAGSNKKLSDVQKALLTTEHTLSSALVSYLVSEGATFEPQPASKLNRKSGLQP